MNKASTKKKAKPKAKKDTMDTKIKKLGYSLKKANNQIDMLRKYIKNVELKLKKYMDRKTSEIRVVEENGTWGDYTGVFYVNSSDEEKIVIDKAMNHYKTYFSNGHFYKNKTLGLFVNNYKGADDKKLVEILKNTGNQLKGGEQNASKTKR